MATATGNFETKSNPRAPYDSADGISIGRVSIAKTFTVEMIGVMTSVKGSAGYVALERVVASVQGKSGSFVYTFEYSL